MVVTENGAASTLPMRNHKNGAHTQLLSFQSLFIVSTTTLSILPVKSNNSKLSVDQFPGNLLPEFRE